MDDKTTAIQEFKDYIEGLRKRGDKKQKATRIELYSVSMITSLCATPEYQNLIASLPNESNDKADGWIKWEGGQPPLSPDVVVEVKYRNGTVKTAIVAFVGGWGHNRGDSSNCYYNEDIIAYRIVEKKTFFRAGFVCPSTGFIQDPVYGDKIVEEKKPEKQTYKLSDMWIGWIFNIEERGTYERTEIYKSKEDLKKAWGGAGVNGWNTHLVAITRADATEFTEGENL